LPQKHRYNIDTQGFDPTIKHANASNKMNNLFPPDSQVKDLVSIIIVTFNGEQHIVDCLNSIQAQTYLQVEIIVYDNASTDQTVNLIRANFPEVNLVTSETNLGFAAANNAAAQIAKGEFLAFLNPDIIVEQNWLNPLIGTLKTETSTGAVTPQIAFMQNRNLVNTCGNTVHFSGVTYCQHYNQPIAYGKPYRVSAISGAAFLISQKLFAELGGFEAKLFMYYEDTDLSLRLCCAGFSCTAVPASIVYHDYTPTFSAQKIFYLERNRYLALFSLINWQLFMLMLPSLLLMECVSWGYAVLQGWPGISAKWQAWLDFFKLRHWLSHRRQTRVCLQPNNLITLFNSRLQAQYVSNKYRLLSKLVEIAAGFFATPALGLAKWLYK
jgi:GT2 family glycosyltransferase